jgi:predicted transcriptional regulator
MAATQLRAIERAVSDLRKATDARNAAMRAARESGETWADIARAAGMTPQGARKAMEVERVRTVGARRT